MSLASFAIAESGVGQSNPKDRVAKPPAKRTVIAVADTVIVSEIR